MCRPNWVKYCSSRTSDTADDETCSVKERNDIHDKTIRYDTIRKKSLTWTQKLSDQLNLAHHVARKKYEKEETKTNTRQFSLSSVQVQDPWKQFGRNRRLWRKGFVKEMSFSQIIVLFLVSRCHSRTGKIIHQQCPLLCYVITMRISDFLHREAIASYRSGPLVGRVSRDLVSSVDHDVEWSRDWWRRVTLKGQTRDPNALRAQYRENSWICYLATIANY